MRVCQGGGARACHSNAAKLVTQPEPQIGSVPSHGDDGRVLRAGGGPRWLRSPQNIANGERATKVHYRPNKTRPEILSRSTVQRPKACVTLQTSSVGARPAHILSS